MKKKFTEDHKRKIGDANRDTRAKYKNKYGENINKLLYQKYEIEKLDMLKVSKSLNLSWTIVRHGLILFNIKIRKQRDYPISKQTLEKYKNRVSSMKDKKHSIATREKISNARKQNPPDLLKKRREKIGILQQKYKMEFKSLLWYLYFDQKKSFADISKIISYSLTQTKRIFKKFNFKPRNSIESHLGFHPTKKTRKKMSKSHKGKKHTPEWIKNVMRRRIPTSLEKEFQEIINKYDLPYKYVGNGSFVIENCNPDFINTNNEKIAIEVYAKYYKSRNGRNIKKWKRERSKLFAKFGWKIFYFDETEVNERKVLKALEG